MKNKGDNGGIWALGMPSYRAAFHPGESRQKGVKSDFRAKGVEKSEQASGYRGGTEQRRGIERSCERYFGDAMTSRSRVSHMTVYYTHASSLHGFAFGRGRDTLTRSGLLGLL